MIIVNTEIQISVFLYLQINSIDIETERPFPLPASVRDFAALNSILALKWKVFHFYR
jgi:hypothetical protein